MNALVVGAGSVGQVFAHHFAKLRSQSLQHLDDFLEHALNYDIEVGSLNELRTELADADTAAKKHAEGPGRSITGRPPQN